MKDILKQVLREIGSGIMIVFALFFCAIFPFLSEPVKPKDSDE